MTQPNFIAAPVSQQERIVLLDSLRGVAILGILMMNIPYFGLPSVVTDDPSILKEHGVDYYTWYIVNLVPEGTMRALFSLLFGAGILLFMGRQESRLAGVQPADYFIRRQLWLLVFSLFDVYILLWVGDILFDYGTLGIVAFAFRKMSPKKLMIAASVCLVLMLVRENVDLYRDKVMIQKGEQIAAMDTTVKKLTPKQNEDLGAMEDFKEKSSIKGRMKRIERSKQATLNSYAELYDFRTTAYMHGFIHYLYFGLWDVLIFMFLGMAFYKMGILTGGASTKVYAWLFVVGTGVGLWLCYIRLQPMIRTQFNLFDYTKTIKVEFYELSRTVRSLGFFGLLLLLYKSNVFKWLFALMRPVGQMAFTNYLGQSLICGLFFYGIGFGKFGHLSRHEVYYVVWCVWIFQIILSHIWLRYFLYGPFEWAWRSLTYWKRQPFVKKRLAD
ncbi:MAG: DUF418 domain-containing protein [Agriterribacter sp.]